MEEFNSYMEQNNRTLVKHRMLNGMDLAISYYPKQLFALNSTDDNFPITNLDSVDYFVAKLVTGNGSTNVDFFETYLVVESDTIKVLDVIRLPSPNGASKSLSLMFAFKSNLGNRKVPNGKIFFMLGQADANASEFEIEDLKQVQKIQFYL
ncbi:MAG: hypothetical protein WKF87_06545 [Chryseolinea sp.]